jgi:hypothetical protein
MIEHLWMYRTDPSGVPLQNVDGLTITFVKETSVMTNERTQAYGRVVQTLDELGPSKLQTREQARIRDAADTLIFASGVDETRDALRDMGILAEALVSSGRWLTETVDRLLEDLLACGPLQVPEIAAA